MTSQSLIKKCQVKKKDQMQQTHLLFSQHEKSSRKRMESKKQFEIQFEAHQKPLRTSQLSNERKTKTTIRTQAMTMQTHSTENSNENPVSKTTIETHSEDEPSNDSTTKISISTETSFQSENTKSKQEAKTAT